MDKLEIVKAENFLADRGWLYLKEHDLWTKDSKTYTLSEAIYVEKNSNQDPKDS